MASLAYRRWLGGFAISVSLLVPALSATAPGCDDPPFPIETDDTDGVDIVPSPSKDDSVGSGLGGSDEGGGGGNGGDGGGPPPIPCSEPSVCDDESLCTIDECIDDLCSNISTAEDNDACTMDICNEETGEISHAPVNKDDLNACTYTCDPATGKTTTNIPFYFTDFEDNAGWIVGPQWFIGSAAPSGMGFGGANDPSSDADGNDPDNIAGTVQGGLVGVQATPSFLTSPPIDLAAVPANEFVTLSFQRLLNMGAPPEMTATVEVLDCTTMGYDVIWSATQRVVDTFPINNTVIQGTGWFEVRLDISGNAQACKAAALPIRVRFGFTSATAALHGGWNIDDFQLTRVLAAADLNICTLDGCDSLPPGDPMGTATSDFDPQPDFDDGDDTTAFSCLAGRGPQLAPSAPP